MKQTISRIGLLTVVGALLALLIDPGAALSEITISQPYENAGSGQGTRGQTFVPNTAVPSPVSEPETADLLSVTFYSNGYYRKTWYLGIFTGHYTGLVGVSLNSQSSSNLGYPGYWSLTWNFDGLTLDWNTKYYALFVKDSSGTPLSTTGPAGQGIQLARWVIWGPYVDEYPEGCFVGWAGEGTCGSDAQFDIVFADPALLPDEQAEVIISVVDDLVDHGVLKSGHGRGLVKPLDNALRSLDKGNTDAACSQIQDFIDEVILKVDGGDGPLPVEDGEDLIGGAEQILYDLDC